jgi:mannosyltransferase
LLLSQLGDLGASFLDWIDDGIREITVTENAWSAFTRLSSFAGEQARRCERWYWALPATLAFSVTVIGASGPSLWGDELATWSAVRRSWSQLWNLFHNLDIVMAPYYIFMHTWIQVFGDSELSLRMPSILAVAATAALLSVLGRRLFSTQVGLFAGVLFAILPGISRVGQETRAIAFTVMFAVLATLVLVIALEAPQRWRWLYYGASVVALGMTSVIALLLLVAHGAFVAQRWYITRDRQPQRWLVSTVGGLLVLSPMIYLGQRQIAQLGWVPKPQGTAFFDSLAITGSIGLGCVLLGLGLVGLKLAGRAWGMLLAWLLVLPVLLYFTSMYGPQSYWVSRYLYFMIPGLVLLVSLSLSWLGARHAVTVFVLLALFVVPLHWTVRSDSGHSLAEGFGRASFNGPAVVDYVSSRLRPGDVALFSDKSSADPRNMLRYYGLPASQLPDALATKSAEEIGRFHPTECAEVAPCLSGVSRAWLFIRYYSGNDPFYKMSAAKGAFLRENFRVAPPHTIGAITVFLLERPMSLGAR